MGNFSYLIQKKFRELNSEQQRIFVSEFERRKKSVGVSYLLWFLLGWHYAYLKKWGWLILYILTVGGFFVWAIIDLFRIPKMVEQYNNDLALEVLRDISIMFPDEERNSSDKDVTKKSVNDLYITQKMQSGESYSFYIIVGIIILFSVSAFFLKPDRAKMQNKIVDDIMISQPQLIKTFKNIFIGEELTIKGSQHFIVNSISKKGYKNIGIYEEDLVILRKLVFRDENSKENLITAYGIFGLTKVVFEDESLKYEEIFRERKQQSKIKESYQPAYENTYNYSAEKYKSDEIHRDEFDNRKKEKLEEDSIQIN